MCVHDHEYQPFVSMFKTSLSISYRPSLLVTNSIIICLFEKCFISPSFIKFICLFRQDIKFFIDRFAFFVSSTLKILSYCPLACKLSAEKPAISIMRFLLQVTRSFLLKILKVLHFYFRNSEYNMS